MVEYCAGQTNWNTPQAFNVDRAGYYSLLSFESLGLGLIRSQSQNNSPVRFSSGRRRYRTIYEAIRVSDQSERSR